jgi:hypothetical protein
LGSAQAIKDANGNIVKWVGVALDIEEIKRIRVQFCEFAHSQLLIGRIREEPSAIYSIISIESDWDRF